MSNCKTSKRDNSKGKSSLKLTLLAAFGTWAVLSIIIFVGMMNYPELPGQTVPKPWMLSVFLLFLVASGLWAHIFFTHIYHYIRIVVSNMIGVKSRASSGGSMTEMLLSESTSTADQWEASDDTPILKILLFAIIEWFAVILGILIPVGALITAGALLTAYLSGQSLW